MNDERQHEQANDLMSTDGCPNPLPANGPEVATGADPRLNRRLLIADESADCRDSLALWFKLHGWDVRTTSNPADTLALIGSFRPVAMFVEVMMPSLPVGYQLIENVRTTFSAVTILCLSGYQTAQHITRCKSLGVRHLLKPHSPQLLLALMTELATNSLDNTCQDPDQP